jgi:hypothetical protein
MALNPFEDARQADQRRRGEYSLAVARVVGVDSAAKHRVAVRPVTSAGGGRTITSPTSATVLVGQRGDIALPDVGDLVIIGRFENREDVVLGTFYSKESDIRDHETDERHIGADDGSTWLHGRYAVPPRLTEHPSDPADGAVWYRSDLDDLYHYTDENGVERLVGGAEHDALESEVDSIEQRVTDLENQ